MRKLKVLVVEYITGGGFNKTELPDHLANEGLLMVQALLENLARVDSIETFVMLDTRLVGRLSVKVDHCLLVGPEQTFEQMLARQITECDAVWPIAPESDAILQALCETVAHSGKILLNSSHSAVRLTGNKWLTFIRLQAHSVACVQSYRLDQFDYYSGGWIVKPVDGVGCENSYLISDRQEFDQVTAQLNKSQFIIQPHLQGEKTSLSCLFKEGRGWLICANRQHFVIINKQYHLTGITVNFTDNILPYLDLVQAIAQAIPDLWGYVGIDLIESEGQVQVLEINPRLTTSFAGIYDACEVNCAELVLGLLEANPTFRQNNAKPVFISI